MDSYDSVGPLRDSPVTPEALFGKFIVSPQRGQVEGGGRQRGWQQS